ncbi:putative TetR family transcriptional regulator [Gordonia hirsuta DSM 44140 = NBRC 16056]|uniref:Putative TetR family transcriptional regulator n=1 Tax=Gordonia hirsuta DSM 44140 = NBRC 16056 TaxID=1121927 RepID=L7L8X9_9ACTN|nr:mycofactocin system transcriptional regulator [Gordonia hirsuta]GAC56482.1 putative TetR family transcriptional regulator [Gordonia hirsuta DSM 44140 = NBRC 16056]
MTRAGRPQSTTRGELSTLAIDLFTERGFDETSVDDVAAAAGISRRTLFRYYPSKYSIPWGDFEPHLEKMRRRLASTPPDSGLGDGLREALVAFNRVPEVELEHHRRRMHLLLKVPALHAHSMLMYSEWRQIIAEHIAAHLQVDPHSHVPQSVAWQFLGASLAAYEQWLDHPETDLDELLDQGYSLVVEGLLPYVEHVLVSRRVHR